MGGPVRSALRVGIVGAGNISGQYSASLARLPQLQVTAVCDLDTERATALASAHDARVLALPELLESDVDVVLVLTLPASHADVGHAAIAAGKHVYVEKPLATSVAQGRELVKAAAEAGVRLGCAPDTVLGTGVQTARAAVDAGRIGRPHAATAFMTTPGHERWHPNPDFYYQPGGGPLLDMGPYYLTSLVHLLGPVVSVTGASSRPQATRTIGSGPRAGETFDVDTDSTVVGILQHASGALSTLVMTFDVWAARLPRIEVHGTEGSLSVPDPNMFDGAVELFPAGGTEWADLGATAGYLDAGRGYGVADLALAVADGRAHRAGDEIALHVLEVMEAVAQAAESRSWIDLTTTCERPEPVPGVVDLTA
ncbi:Gfo/Idh/MocA family protein [Pseudonocardia sp. CA-107938]|uniref:Gfo/Idh/MocA family protein n=1 Tax=Pseudonocardia sp. CA-107938 TaxID=3240021 RepID=UPI003D8B5205